MTTKKNFIHPLSLPNELMDEARDLAKLHNLKIQDILRLAVKAGLPVVRSTLAPLDTPNEATKA